MSDTENQPEAKDEPIEVDVDSRVDEGYSADADEVSDEEAEQLEKEREERLDPENRPANAEVDNTQRGFDPGAEDFEKSGDEVDNGPVIGADRPDDIEVDDED